MFILVILFAVFIGFVAIFNVLDDVAIDLNNSGALTENARSQLEQNRLIVPDMVDQIYLMVFFGAFISIIAAAYLIQSNFIFFFVGVIILAILVFMGAVFSNVAEDYLASDASIQSFADENLTFSKHILDKYPLYTAFLGFLVLAALYAKTTGNVGSGV